MRPEGRYLSEQAAVDRTQAHGYSTERTEDEWREHWDAHPEAFAALYAVVYRGFTGTQVRPVLRPFYSVPPVVEDWVWTPAQRRRMGR
jgi:hypothetical protein